MCNNLYVLSPLFHGTKNDMDQAGLKFDPQTDKLICKALAEADIKLWDLYLERHPEEIPF